MKTQIKSCIVTALCGVVFTLQLYGQGTAFTYQGRLSDNGSPANGIYQFRFAVFDSASAGNQIGPTLSNISAGVSNGLFTVTLNFGANIFTGPSRWLEIGARTNGSAAPFTVLTPRQALLPTPYSVLAGAVPAGAINGSMLANGSVTAANIAAGAVTTTALANNSVGSAQLGDTLDLGASTVNGRLDVFRTSAGTPALRLDGANNSMTVYSDDDGGELGRFVGQSYGLIELRDSNGHQVAAQLSANGDGGGLLTLHNSNGVSRARLSGENVGGALSLYQADGSQLGAVLDGYDTVGAGRLELYNTNGAVRTILWGGPEAGRISLYQADGNFGLHASAAGSAGTIALYNQQLQSILLQGSQGNGAGGQILMYNSGAINTIEIDAQVGTGGGFIGLRNGNNIQNIVLDGNNGIVKGQVVQITGGSDLSENFDISGAAHEPGMIVSIDPANPGRLVRSTSAYDKRVAGIISGAGGVRPGMLMGQRGSIADGKHPVALSGRVYCWVDAGASGAIEPGDMVTTSDTAGHGMKVTDATRAAGAIIGKAMTRLAHGKGLVLVLVNLQ